MDRLTRMGNASANDDVISTLGLLEEYPGILVGKDDLARAGVERNELALEAPEVGSDWLHRDRW